MSQIYNFSAGPAALPAEVMSRVQDEFLNCRKSGLSVVEMSHRSSEFQAIAAEAEQSLRALLDIPDSHAVLFMQGGATTQFAMVPCNLLGNGKTADYFHTGYWSGKAVKEASRFCDVNLAVDASANKFTAIPEAESWELKPNAAYVHYTPNETIGGVEFHSLPDTRGVPLVADMSSNILSRAVDISRFALIYAGAQKNVGPSGLTLVIVDKAILGNVTPGIPSMLDYQAHLDAGSMYNTPPTFAWYVAGLVFKWVEKQGGVSEMERRNLSKSKKLYAAIDSSDFYSNPVAVESRSRMNVPFMLADNSLEGKFLEQAREAGLVNLEGHRSVGGMRASIYNAMPEDGVDALIAFLEEFENSCG